METHTVRLNRCCVISGIVMLYVMSVMISANIAVADQRTDAEKMRRVAQTTFRPLYGPLAEDIIGTLGIENLSGTGIDIGGGPGSLVVELARRTPSMRWVNVDINPHVIPFVENAARQAGLADRVTAHEADAVALPYADDSIDVAVSRGSFQFWGDLDKGLAEIVRVLKPGGAAYIGRGFSPNLPVETARTIRDRQRQNGFMPSYDVKETADRLESAIRKLGITNYSVRIPAPRGGDGVSYGVWIVFYKPGGATVRSTGSAARLYTLMPLEVTGKSETSVVVEPMTESAGLAASVSVIDKEDIVLQGADTVIEALQYVPGAWIETRGRKVKQFFSVRGQKYPYPEYALDGALFREFHEMPYFFSSRDIERIEVMRSSAAMLTGISGLGGVVNLVPRRYTRPETSWDISYGSFETYRAHLSHGASLDRVSYALGIDVPHTDGPDDRHAAEGVSNFYGSADWMISEKMTVRTTLFHLNGKRELALAEPPAGKRFQETEEEFDPAGGTFAQMRAQYLHSDRASTELSVAWSDRDDTFISRTDSTYTTSRDWDYEWSVNLVQSYGITESNTMRAAAFVNRWIAPEGKRFYSGRRQDLATYALVLADEQRFGRLLLDGALRWQRSYINEYAAYNIDGSAKGFNKVPAVTDEWEPSVLTGSLGAEYFLSDMFTLAANATAGEVRPRSGTLDENLKEPGTERRFSVDAGIVTRCGVLERGALTGFMVMQQDALVLSGATQEVNGRVYELYNNRDQDQLGVELDLRTVPFASMVSGFGNVTLMRSRADIIGDMEDDREKPDFIAALGVNAATRGFDLNMYVKSVGEYESARFAGDGEMHDIGGFTTLDFTLGKTFTGRLGTRAYLEVENVTDKKYSTVVGYPDFGRRITVGIQQTFH